MVTVAEQHRKLGRESNQEIVSFCFVHACVRACARSGCLMEFDPKRARLPFPFPFGGAELSLFPCERMYKVYKVYEVYKVYKVYKMYKVLLP